MTLVEVASHADAADVTYLCLLSLSRRGYMIKPVRSGFTSLGSSEREINHPHLVVKVKVPLFNAVKA